MDETTTPFSGTFQEYIDSFPDFDTTSLPLDINPNAKPSGYDELGQPVFKTKAGEVVNFTMTPPKTKSVVKETGRAVADYLRNPTFNAEAVGTFAKDVVKGAYQPLENMATGKGTVGDLISSVGTVATPAWTTPVEAGTLRIFGGRRSKTIAPDEKDSLLEYNTTARTKKGILDRDTVAPKDNILYRPDRAYRFIGEEGYKDFVESGLIRAKPDSKQGYDVPYFMKGKTSSRYAGKGGDKYVVEAIPNKEKWKGAAITFDEDPYVGPNEGLNSADEIRIYKKKEDGTYEVVLDNIGDVALLDEVIKGYASGGVVTKMDNEMNTLMKEGGLNTDGATTDPVSGNEVPTGSTAEEVRDDIPAQLSENEYVIPADVVKFFGVSFFEKLRAKAKAGLAEMDAEGRIGGEDATEEDDDEELPFGVDELQTEDDDMDTQMQNAGFAKGGAVTGNPTPADIEANKSTFNPAAYPIGFSVFGNQAAAPVTQAPAATTTKVYVNKQGQTVVIPFDANGNPTIPIPAGYTLQTADSASGRGSGGGGGQGDTAVALNTSGTTGGAGRIKLEDFASEDTLIASGMKDIEQLNASKKIGGVAGSLLGGGVVGGLVGSLAGTGYQLSELRAKIQLADKYGMTKAAETLRAAEAEATKGLSGKWVLDKLASGNMLAESFYKKNPTLPTTAVKPDGTVGPVAGTGTSGGGGGGTAPKPTTPIKATGTATTKAGTGTATKAKVGVTTKAGTGTIAPKSGGPISVKGSITTGTKPSTTTPSPKNTKGKATGGLMQKSKK